MSNEKKQRVIRESTRTLITRSIMAIEDTHQRLQEWSNETEKFRKQREEFFEKHPQLRPLK